MSMQDKSSVEYQRKTWNALSIDINRLVNNVNAENFDKTVPELFGLNIIRGMGLFCQACISTQTASLSSTVVIAALVAVINSEYDVVSYLLVKRVILLFRSAFVRNEMPQLYSAAKFIAHLVNQRVLHTLVAFEVAELLLKMRTNGSVLVAVAFVVECGSTLQNHCSPRWDGIFERFRGILCDREIAKFVRFLIECLFAAREAKFQGYLAVRPELDVFDMDDQVTHLLSLFHEIDAENALNVFSPDPNFVENEKTYEKLKELLVFESDDETDSDCTESAEEDDEQMVIDYKAERINLRKRVCLTIMTSADCREAVLKLLDIKLKPGQEMELCTVLVRCGDEERDNLCYNGQIAKGLCAINRIYQENFEKCFVHQYSTAHQLEYEKLCNVTQFFAHLLCVNALPWHVLACIRLTEVDTTSWSRGFIRFLFLRLSEHLGIKSLNERLTDPRMQDSFESIFPKDKLSNTKFAIDFFTSIGLGGITENLQEYLKNMQQQKDVPELDSQWASSGSDSDSSHYTVTSLTDSDSDDEWIKITKATRN